MGWLVLHRSEGESLMIGDAEVVVKRVCGSRATLAINAPPDVLVLRKELTAADLARSRAALEDGKEDRT